MAKRPKKPRRGLVAPRESEGASSACEEKLFRVIGTKLVPNMQFTEGSETEPTISRLIISAMGEGDRFRPVEAPPANAQAMAGSFVLNGSFRIVSIGFSLGVPATGGFKVV